MKRKFFAFFTIAMFSVNVANAQLDNILNKVKSAATTAASKTTHTSNSTVTDITNIISSKLVPTSKQIIGTWSYDKPAIMYTSSNSLKTSAASLATSKLETKLQAYIEEAGVKKGSISITYKEDNTFTINRNGKSIASGTYAINGSELTMSFKGKQVPAKLTPQLIYGSLCLVGDATKLKTLMENAGAKLNSSTVSAITSLSKTMDGMKIGIKMKK